eukprot:94188-Chlamydomonas_euryale.AAC.1
MHAAHVRVPKRKAACTPLLLGRARRRKAAHTPPTPTEHPALLHTRHHRQPACLPPLPLPLSAAPDAHKQKARTANQLTTEHCSLRPHHLAGRCCAGNGRGPMHSGGMPPASADDSYSWAQRGFPSYMHNLEQIKPFPCDDPTDVASTPTGRVAWRREVRGRGRAGR